MFGAGKIRELTNPTVERFNGRGVKCYAPTGINFNFGLRFNGRGTLQRVATILISIPESRKNRQLFDAGKRREVYPIFFDYFVAHHLQCF